MKINNPSGIANVLSIDPQRAAEPGYERESGLSVAVSRGALDSIRSAMAGWG